MRYPPDEGPDFLHKGKLLNCGHHVSAHEEDQAFEERSATEADVAALLQFRIETHDCERFEKELARRVEGGPPF
jgi:hypothetical protein